MQIDAAVEHGGRGVGIGRGRWRLRVCRCRQYPDRRHIIISGDIGRTLIEVSGVVGRKSGFQGGLSLAEVKDGIAVELRQYYSTACNVLAGIKGVFDRVSQPGKVAAIHLSGADVDVETKGEVMADGRGGFLGRSW